MYPMSFFSPDGKILAAESGGHFILWDVASHEPIGQPLIGHSVAFTPDGKTIASAVSDETIIVLWDVASQQPIGQTLTGHVAPVGDLAFQPRWQNTCVW